MVPKRKQTIAVCAFLGSLVLLIAIYVTVVRIVFLANANAAEGPIVAVTHEYVPQGRGGVLAYVPTIEVQGAQGRPVRIKVDTFNERPVYAVGQQMQVLCNPERGCIEDSLFARWGISIIDLLISLLFFGPLLAHRLGLWPPDDDLTELNLQRDT